MKDLALGLSLMAATMLFALAPARALPVAAMLQVGTQSLSAASCATRDTL